MNKLSMQYIDVLRLFWCGITLQLFVSVDLHEDEPTFKRVPQNGFPREGEDFSLYCHASGSPKPSIKWYKDGEVVQTQHDLPGTSNKIISERGLLFLGFSKEDEGNYFCNASNIHGWTVSPSATVKIAFFSSTDASGPSNKVVNVGERVLIECIPPDGLPKPDINWTFNDNQIFTNSRVKIFSNGTLMITSVEFNDRGKYYCAAKNTIGSWKSPAGVLTITRQPQVYRHAMIGSSVEFNCETPDNTNSTIIWSRSGKEIPQALLRGNTLVLNNVQLSDSGTYICKTENPTGYVQHLVNLSIISPPTLLITPDDQITTIGSQVAFNCLTTGAPAPTVRWIHNSHTYLVPVNSKSRGNDGRIHVLPNGTLIITSVLPVDGGYFECRASQIAGLVRSFAKLVIRTPPIPVINVGPQNQTILAGTIATMGCDASVLHFSEYSINKSSSVTIHWFFNNNPVSQLNDPRIVSLGSHYLQVNSVRVSDEGNYTCQAVATDFASNGMFSYFTTWSAMIKVSHRKERLLDVNHLNEIDESILPEPPSNVTVHEVGDTWLAMEMDMSSSNCLASCGFRVEVTRYEDINAWRIVVPVSVDRHIRVENLIPLSAYHILVRSVNRGIVGRPYILKTLVYTIEKLPPDLQPPSGFLSQLERVTFSRLHLHPISSSEVLCQTSVCGSDSILRSIIGVRASVRQVPTMDCLLFNAESNAFVIAGKKAAAESSQVCPSPGIAYADRVEENDFCSLSEFSRLDSWNKPATPILSIKHVNVTIHSGLKPSKLLTFVLPNLKPFTCYSVELRVAAVHSQLNRKYSPSTSERLVLTYESVPLTSPTIHSARWLDNGNILDISWILPVDGDLGGLLAGYSIWIFSSSSHMNESFHVEPHRTSFKFRTLNQWSNYTIYLAALNCRGEGVRSLPFHVFAYSVTDSENLRLFDLDNTHVVLKLEGDRVASSVNALLSPSQSYLIRWFTYGDQQLRIGQTNQPGELGETALPFAAAFINHPWFIPGLVGCVILIVMIIILLVVCGRYHLKRSSFQASSLGQNGLLSKSGRLMPQPDPYTSSGGLSSTTPLLTQRGFNSYPFCSSSPSPPLMQQQSYNPGAAPSATGLPLSSYDPSHTLFSSSFASSPESTGTSGPVRQLPALTDTVNCFTPAVTGLSPRINVPNPCDNVLVGRPQPLPVASTNGVPLSAVVSYATHNPHHHHFLFPNGQPSPVMQTVVNCAVLTRQTTPRCVDPRLLNHSSASSSPLSSLSAGNPAVGSGMEKPTLTSLVTGAVSQQQPHPPSATDEDEDERLVNPYASVPVAYSHRQLGAPLTLSDLIPPPPDSPPPAVPPSESSPVLPTATVAMALEEIADLHQRREATPARWPRSATDSDGRLSSPSPNNTVATTFRDPAGQLQQQQNRGSRSNRHPPA